MTPHQQRLGWPLGDRSSWQRQRRGNLASATPTLGARSWGTAFRRALTSRASATVQALKAVHSDIGRTQFRSLHPVADPLQRGENLCEHPAVVRLVGFEN